MAPKNDWDQESSMIEEYFRNIAVTSLYTAAKLKSLIHIPVIAM